MQQQQVNIKHKVFANSAEQSSFLSKFIDSDILTAVNRRLTTKHARLPFAMRIRPHQHYHNGDTSVITSSNFVTIYIDDNIELPARIMNKINSIEYTRDTTGLLKQFIYLGEVSSSFHIHYGFYRCDHFYRKENDYYQSYNDNYLVVLKLYDGVTAEMASELINQNIDNLFNPGYYWRHPTATATKSYEIMSYEIEELEDAQFLYRKTLELRNKVGEIEMVSQLVQEMTKFGANRLKYLAGVETD